MTEKSYTTLHWVARILSIPCFILSVIALYVVMTDPASNLQVIFKPVSFLRWIGFILVLIGVFATPLGLLLAWRRGAVGGWLCLAGILLISLVGIIVDPLTMPFLVLFFWPIGIPGLLFVIVGKNRPITIGGQTYKRPKSLTAVLSDYFRK